MRTIEELHRATEKNDIPASIDAHLRFHRLFYDFSGHSILQSLWNGWEIKLRLYLAVDHRTYSDPHDIAVEHERLAAVRWRATWTGSGGNWLTISPRRCEPRLKTKEREPQRA